MILGVILGTLGFIGLCALLSPPQEKPEDIDNMEDLF